MASHRARRHDHPWPEPAPLLAAFVIGALLEDGSPATLLRWIQSFAEDREGGICLKCKVCWTNNALGEIVERIVGFRVLCIAFV